MHRIRPSGFFAMLTSALGLAAVCALTPAVAATAAASPIATVVQSDPPPEDKPCPGGEPKPCGASNQERDSVDSGRKEAKDDAKKAKEDIADAKNKAKECAPGSAQGKTCMGNLLGAGSDQLVGMGDKERAGMDTTQNALDGLRPAPADNATPAVSATCTAFAADLPAMFTAPGDVAELTGVCELMNR